MSNQSKTLSREERISAKSRAAFAAARAQHGRHLDIVKGYVAKVESTIQSGDVGAVVALGQGALREFEVSATQVQLFVRALRLKSSESREAVEKEDVAAEKARLAAEAAVEAVRVAREADAAEAARIRKLLKRNPDA